MTSSTNYYDQNAQRFFEGTVDVDMSKLYEHFLPLIPAGGSILDAGCGSGRDALAFQNNGYDVTAVDASKELCKLASALLRKPVQCIVFNAIVSHKAFDAVWACASLLHVPKVELSDSIKALIRSLKSSGVMYCSFKWGDKERMVDSRLFTDMTDKSFKDLMSEISPSALVETWITEDQRPGRDEKWLNALITIV